MRKIIVLTLLFVVVVPVLVFAATDWSAFESGRDNIRLEGYQGQPGYIQFQDGSGTKTIILYWNKEYDELFVLSPDERDITLPIGTASATGTNVGVPIDGTADLAGRW